MKKTFLNLRKMGFVLVAATSMLAFSCGGEEVAEDATEAIENLGDELNSALDEAMDTDTDDASCEDGACEDGACDGGDTTGTDSCEDGACEDGACEGGDEHSCEHGE